MEAKAQQMKDELDQLEAQRLIDTVRLRSQLIRECTALLPEAIRQAKPSGQGKSRRPGSPALLRLITRVAMRPALSPQKERS